MENDKMHTKFQSKYLKGRNKPLKVNEAYKGLKLTGSEVVDRSM